MTADRIRSVVATIIATFLAGAGEAGAIPLPDSSSCSISGASNACLKITNTTSSNTGAAISGVATSNFGIRGSSTSGVGINASSFSNIGLNATSTSSYAVAGSSSGVRPFGGVYGANNSTGYGVIGHNYGTDSSCTGHTVQFAGLTGLNCAAAVFGDANGNETDTWAGLFNGDLNIIGRLWLNGQVQQLSDQRAKKDIKDAPYGVEDVLRLHPVTYKWKRESADGTQIGFIAQEVQKVVPEVVLTRGKSDLLSLNYSGLIPVLVRALQDQEKVSRDQENRLAALERGSGPGASIPGPLGAVAAVSLLPLGLIGVAVGRRRRDRTTGKSGN